MTQPEHPLAPFLQRFFGPGNDLRWDAVRPDSGRAGSDSLRPFIRDATASWERLILPRSRSGVLCWYAMARDERDARVLREELLAFLGPSFTDFRGQHASLDPSDSVDAAVLEFAGTSVFRLNLVDPGQREACRNALLGLLNLRARMPRSTRPVPRPPGRILRDFELAVQRGAQADAEGFLGELKLHGGLSARNLRFLEVHIHERFEEWEALYALLDDGAVVQAERPTRVTRALIRAVYRRELATFEAAGQAELALARFVEVVLPNYGRLFRSLTGLDGAEILKSFLLALAASDSPSTSRRDALLERYPRTAPDRPYAEALGRLVHPRGESPPSPPLDQARAAFAEGDLDGAFETLSHIDPSLLTLDLMLRCALEMRTLEAAGAALAAFDRAGAAIQKQWAASPRLQRSLGELRERFGTLTDSPLPVSNEPVPGNWLAWIERLRADPTWSGAVAVAAQGAVEWSVEQAALSPTEMRAFASTLREELPPLATDALLNALPYLLEFFVRRPGSTRAFAPVCSALRDRLLYVGTLSAEAIRAAGSLLDVQMRWGMDVTECHSAVSDLRSAWHDLPTVDLIDWGLDVFDRLVTSQGTPEDAQVAFAMEVYQQFEHWRDRITVGQVALFRQVCREARINIDDFFPSLDKATSREAGPDRLPARISSGVVALYSLRPEVLRRVRDVLGSLAPAVTVKIFSDAVGNDALKTAARTADVFLIVTGAAKHPATEFIEANRPKDRVTLRCHATGAAGLLRTLAEG